ncbi:MAG: hypothetical protein Fur0010_02040 [Bdellovibrio sp.]
MRLLIVSPTYWNVDGIKGGAERYVRELALALYRSQKFSSVRVVTYSSKIEDLLIDDGLEVEIHRTTFVNDNPSNPVATFRSLFRFDYDVVYIHQFHTWITMDFSLWSLITRKKVILTDHNGGGWCFNRQLKINWFIDHFFATSPINATELNLKFRKTSFIWGGVDLLNFSYKKECEIQSDVLFVGRLKDIKGTQKICEILEKVSSQGRITFAYTLPSSDEERRNEERLLSYNGKIGNWSIQLLCDLHQSDLVKIYNSHRWTILPSEYRPLGKESLGLTVLESLACGTAAICSPDCGIAQFAQGRQIDFFKVCTDWKKFFEQEYRQNFDRQEIRTWAEDNLSWNNVAIKITQDLGLI